MDPLRIGPQHTIPAEALSWSASRAEGPGGQHVNKTSTRVELRCDVTLARLPEGVLRRMRAEAPRWFDGEGNLILASQQTRSQRRNLEEARERLAELVRACWSPPKKRRPTRPSRGARERRITAKKQRGAIKKNRRWTPE